MPVVRFGWLGSTRQSIVHTALLDEIEAWAHDWRWSPQSCVAAASVRPIQGAAIDLVWSTPAGGLACSLGASSLAALGAMLAGTDADDEDDLALSLGRAAIEQLSHRICRRAGLAVPAEPGEERAMPPELSDVRLGAYRAVFALDTLYLQVSLTRALCDRLAPPPADNAPRPALVSRGDAIATTPLALSAILDFGEVSLAFLSDLRVGEVLVSDLDLHAPLTVQVEGHGDIAAARLHRRQDRRAVVLHAPLQPTS